MPNLWTSVFVKYLNMLLLLIAKYKAVFNKDHIFIIVSAVHSDVSELFISCLPFLKSKMADVSL